MSLKEVGTIGTDEIIDRGQFRKVKLLFHVLSALPVEERSEVLDALCPEDATVRNVVRSLLAERGLLPAVIGVPRRIRDADRGRPESK